MDENKKTISVRDFTSEEIKTLNYYVTSQTPNSIIPQFFILTEEREKKIKIFLSIYRIIQSSKTYAGNPKTKRKLDLLLNECEEPFTKLMKSQMLLDEGMEY